MSTTNPDPATGPAGGADPPPDVLFGIQHTEDVDYREQPLPTARWGWWQHIHGPNRRAGCCPMAFANIEDALAAVKAEEDSEATDGAFRVALLGVAPWPGLCAPPAQHLRFGADQRGQFNDAIAAIFDRDDRNSLLTISVCQVAWLIPRGQLAGPRGEAAWCARADGGRDLVRTIKP